MGLEDHSLDSRHHGLFVADLPLAEHFKVAELPERRWPEFDLSVGENIVQDFVL